MKIRDAAPRETPALLSISIECFGANAWRQKDFEAVERAGFARWVLVAEGLNASDPSGRIPLSGYVVVECSGSTVEIQSLAVRPTFRRQGVGTELLSQGLNRARNRGATEAFLEVRESNEAARSFYRRHRFEEIGRRGRYYRDPEEDAVLMRWQPEAKSGM